MFILFQGTMEEKIYERQVTKQSLSQRVIDEHQIDRHFNSNDLRELYLFRPDRLDDPNRKERPTPALPKVIIISLKNSTLKTKNMTNYQNIAASLNIIFLHCSTYHYCHSINHTIVLATETFTIQPNGTKLGRDGPCKEEM
jgi:hypothetical protein